MIVRGFKSVLWVGAVGSAALSCYMVSLRVATERADLARVQGQIVDAKRDIRSLQTELGTRGRLSQLEDWNTNVLALSAPATNQYVKDGYALARLETHEPTVEERTGEVRMASVETGQAAAPATTGAPASQAKPAAGGKPAAAPPAPAPEAAPLPRIVQAVAPASRAAPLMRRASFTLPPTSALAAPAATGPAAAKAASAGETAAAEKPAKKAKAAAKSGDVVTASTRQPHRAVAAATRKPDGAKPAAASLAGADAAAHKPNKAKPAHGAARLAGTDAAARKSTPAKPVHGAVTRLARADAAVRPQASGHRGGAQ
jgi:hypothetical protein